jgi:hypothetical protein
MGDRKERMTSTGPCPREGDGISYVRLVVDASKLEPLKVGYETLKLCDTSVNVQRVIALRSLQILPVASLTQ